MLSYLERLSATFGIPAVVVTGIIILFFIMQVVGEICEFKGKAVPELMKIRKYFKRRKEEKQTAREAIETLKEVKVVLANVDAHYSKDNIAMRDQWIADVNQGLAESRAHWKRLEQLVIEQTIEDKRSAILAFASRVADPVSLATHEEFRRIFRIHREYEDILSEQGLTNGEVTIAIHMINEAYEDRLRNRSFVEDIRGYEG